MKRLLAKSILLAGGMSISSHILALGLGEMELDSALNQPLSAEIKLIDTAGLSNSEIKPKLASVEDFERAGIDRYQFLTQMKFSVNGDRILITTRDPVNEPFLNFLVELNWPAGRVLREYTVLLDPPVFEEGRVQPLVAVPAGSVQSDTTVTTQSPEPATKPAPRPANRWQTPAEPGTYKVQPNDTLWEIALATRPNSSITPQQMMIALQDVNPDAFINGNINRLKTHTVLDIPDASIVETVNNSAAVAEVVRQNRELKAGAAQIDATGRTADTSGPRKAEGKGEVRLLSSDAKGESSQSGGAVAGATGSVGEAETDLAIALENLDKSQRENQELVQRLTALEEQLAKMERLIALQNDQLASMQVDAAQSAEIPAQPVPAEAASDTAETPVAEADKAQAVAEDNTAESTDAADAQPMAEEQGTDYNYSEGQTETSSETEVAEPAQQTEQTENAASEPVQTAEQEAMAARAAAEARKAATESQKTIVDKIMAIPYQYFAFGAGLLLMLLYAVMKMRARKEEDAVSAAEAELDAAEAAEAGVGSDSADDLNNFDMPDNNDLPDFGENNLSGGADDGFGNFDLGEDDLNADSAEDLADLDLDAYEDADGEYETVGQTEDAISESDIYIAYGKFDQAIDLLKGAVAAEPERTDLRLKQLEVLASLDDSAAFAEVEADLITLGDADANATAADLRAQLTNPVEPEIRSDDALSLDGDLPSLDESSEDEFEGGMDFGDALDFGDDTKPEDDGIGAQLEELPELELGESSDFDAQAEGVDMSLEEDAPELDDELLNFDMEDTDNLDSEESGDTDILPELDINELDDDLTSDLSTDSKVESEEPLSFEAQDVASESEEPQSTDIDFSIDDFDLDSPELDAPEGSETVTGPATSEKASPLDADDLSLDFEVADEVGSNESLDDLLTDDDALDISDNELPELSFEDASDDDTPEIPEIETPDTEELGEVTSEPEEVPVASPEEEPQDTPVEVPEEETKGQSDDAFEATSPQDDGLEALMSADADDLADNSDLIGGIDLDELAAADDEFDFLAGTDECATKLDLARAYVDMEDIDGARELLQEVVQEGNDAQKQEAKDLMDKLA